MPAEVISSERYCVYSTDGSNDDNKSICSERNSFMNQTGGDCIIGDCSAGLSDLHITNGKVVSCSPVISSTTLDRWGSYWSRRERCCCFWNFLLSTSLLLTVTIVILATKGIIFSNFLDNAKSVKDDIDTIPGFIAPINVECEHTSHTQKTCTDSECLRSSVDILGKINLSVDPCHDFYSYACGGFMDKVRLSWNSPRKRTNPDVIMESYFNIIEERLSEDVLNRDRREVKVIKTIYKSCLHHKNTPMTKLHTIIDSLGGFEFGVSKRTREINLTALLSEAMLKYGVSPLFEVDVTKAGKIVIYNRYSDEGVRRRYQIGRPVHRYKLLKPSDFFYRNEETDQLLQAYKKYISDLLAFIMEINDTTRGDQRFVTMVNDIYHLNVYINRVLYKEDMTNFSNGATMCKQQFNLDGLQSQYPYNITWQELFSALFKGTTFSNNFTICSASLTTELSDVLFGFTFTTLKRFIIFQVLTTSDISYLLPQESPKFDQVSWGYGALSEKIPGLFTENDCLKQISQHLPLYFVILNHSSERFNDTLMRLFTDLISSIERIIRQLYWIPIKQKQYLLSELQGLTMRFEGYRSVDNYVLIYMQNISDDYFENLQLMIGLSSKNAFHGRPQISITEAWSSIIHLREKELEIPLSVLQSPLAYMTSTPSLFLGSLGTYISQAISELFDIEALLRYLTEDKIDHKVALTIAFRLQCLLDEYRKYPLVTNDGIPQHIRGDLTKSANFKDSLALKVVYETYKRMKHSDAAVNIPGLGLNQDQLFFLSYAQSMCEKTNIRGTRYYYINTTTTHHSPGKYRVIGTLSHFKKFAEAFNCKNDALMNPIDKCTFL